MASHRHPLLSFLSLLLLSSLWGEASVSMPKKIVRVGVILDLNSTVGEMAKRCIFMALSDFYAVNANFRTRLSLIIKDSRDDVVAAAFDALDLMRDEKVHAIIGPQRSAQAKFVIDLGQKAQVPIISFSATSPALSPTRNPFFIRTAPDDSSQVKPLTAIVQAHGWRDVVLVYEDTEYGHGLIPYLIDALQKINVPVPYKSVISPSSQEDEIWREICKLKAMQRKVFLVHMAASLGSKFFVLVKVAGIMDKGYAWIVTQGLSTLLDPVSSDVMNTMQGVVGIRQYIPMSDDLEVFIVRWKKKLNLGRTSKKITHLNLFGLWAYDTIWALAMAVENIAGLVQNDNEKNIENFLGLNTSGTKLLETIRNTKFQGLSGDFHLVNGQLERSIFQVFNVMKNTERVLGYWTPKRGFSRDLDEHDIDSANYTVSMEKLKQPIWPGGTKEQPNKLRIGVPVATTRFPEFVNVEWGENNSFQVSGFSIEVFRAVQKQLMFPLPFEFIPFANEQRQINGTYNQLLYKIKLHELDAVVGDITIVANRSSYVDFTLPYLESGVSMVVLMKNDDRKNIWIFLKPLSLDLWLTTGATFIFTGLVIWVLEHRLNLEFRGPPRHQLGTIFWFSFSTLVFGHRERVVNNLSRLVLIIWVFVVLIITQSYTASLASMLTVQRLRPTYVDAKELQRNGHSVGYQENSFVKELLIEQLHFQESKLRPYHNPEEYHKALSEGSVAAIFDEIPYIKVLLASNCSKLTMVGPIYQTGGFGFAFPIGSPLVSSISRAILNVTEDKTKMERIMASSFRTQTPCQDQEARISSESHSLSVYSFGGLFIITGIASMSSLLIYILSFLFSHWPSSNAANSESTVWSRFVELAKLFDHVASPPLQREDSRVHPSILSPEGIGASPVNNAQNPWISDEGEENVDVDENNECSSSGHGDTSMGV